MFRSSNFIRYFGTSTTQAKVRVLVSNTHDPFFNLATEEWLFRSGDISIPTLFLWRNEPTVVIGRCQNPWKECDLAKMKEKGVHLARRYSGGGTVYQDLGNTNFTFLTSLSNHDKERNSRIIMNAISTFGLSAEASGRNDLLVDGFKISGAAYKLSPPRALHHGTLLIDVDMSALAGLLHPNKLKLQSKGIASVSSRVKNLRQFSPRVTHEALSRAIIDAFCAFYGAEPVPAEDLDRSSLSSISMLEKVYNEMTADAWRFGMSPDFRHHLEGRFEAPSPWGTLDVHLEASRGVIEAAQVFSDSLHPDLIDVVAQALRGAAYSPAGVGEALDRVAAQPGLGVEGLPGHLRELADWLSASL